MAEVAAGAIAAEQLVMTGVEAGAAVAVAKPTQPLKGTLSQLSVPIDEDKLGDLARSHHTVTVIGGRAYIVGGEQSDGQLCSTDVHAIHLPSDHEAAKEANPSHPKVPIHTCYPPFPLKDATTGETLLPARRTRHAAAARGDYLLVHGGVDASGNPLAEGPSTIWLWDSGTLKWARINATVQLGAILAPRHDHAMFVDATQDILVLHGGVTSSPPTPSAETWLYDFDSVAWTELPAAPVAGSSASSTAYADGTLYTVGTPGDGPDDGLGGSVHFLRLGHSAAEREKPLGWRRVDFPANPLAPGPRLHLGGALVPVATGHGRSYLVYMFGSRAEVSSMGAVAEPATAGSSALMVPPRSDPHPLLSDIWSLQLPSEGFTASHIKDAIRERIPGLESTAFTWAEVEVLPREEIGHDGKAHPGPRAHFGAAGCLDGRGVFIWGGVSADGQKQGDGWVLKLF